jgi:signal transduction histidine kinase
MKPHAVLSIVVLPLLLLLGVVTIITYSKFASFIDYAGQAEHTRAVMVNLANVMSATREAETNQRGFLLTNDSSFLEAYRKAATNVHVYTLRLDSLSNGEVSASARKDTLQTLLAARFQAMENVLAMNAEQSKNELSTKLFAGREIMVRLQKHVDLMLADEQRDLNVASMETKTLIELTPLLLLVLSMFSIVVLLISYLFISRELRIRLNTQELLESKVDDLNRSNRELEQFAYVASHDLQEPLRKIQAFGDRMLIKHKNKIDTEIQTGITKMQNAAARMQVLIDDLLAYSRVVHLEDEFVDVDLNEVLSGVLSDLEISIRNKNGLVEADKLPVVRAVPLQMQQLFLNLLSNAIKFSKPEVPPRVHISYDKVKGNSISEAKPSQHHSWFHRIAVADQGIGFNAEYSKKIFVIFQQLHNKMEFGGTGIGLAVCKKITENHGGFIDAASNPAEGSTFYIYLPV